MAKRRPAGSSELPFVALMDTMTNIVGVLTIVLVMIGISLAKAVRKVLAELPAVSIEQIQTAQTQLDQISVATDAARKQLDVVRRDPHSDAKLNAELLAELARLELAAADASVPLVDLETPRAELAKREAEFKASTAESLQLIAERKRLTDLLEKTPLVKQPARKVVRMPEARDIPSSAEIYYAYVIDNQIHLLDPISAKRRVMEEFHQQSVHFINQVIKVKRAKDRVIYDQAKIVAHFAKLNLSVRGQKISVPANPTSTQLALHIAIDPAQGGTVIADPLPPNSEWQRVCERLRSFPRGVLIFRVRPDSFATYLRAREIADALRLPCGWEIDGSTAFDVALDEFEVNRLAQPAPPPPGPPPAPPPPGQPEPPLPKRRLD